MISKNYPILLFLFFILLGCSDNKPTDFRDTTNEPVLTIGKVKLSKYEFLKNFNNFQGDFIRANGHAPAENEVKEWETKFINRTYLLADAYDKGYDKDPHIDSMVEGAARFMVSQPNGLLEQALTGVDISKANQPLNNDPLMAEKLSKRQEMLNNYYEKVTAQAKISVNDTVVNNFYNNIINYNYAPNHTFQKHDFGNMLPTIVMTYTSPHNKHVNITVGDFIEFYNTLFIKQAIKDPNVIVNYLISIPKSIYAYNEAEKRGITKQSKFLLDRNNFKNQLIYNKYSTDNLENKQIIGDAELRKEYDRIKNTLMLATDAVASFYYFTDKGSAALAMMRLKQPSLPDDIKLSGIVDIKKHVKVNYKSGALPDTLLKTLFSMRKGDVSRPMYAGGSTVLIKKEEESGNRTLSLSEVRGLIMQKIKSDRLAKNTINKAAALKDQYSIENNITPSLYQLR